MWIVPRSVSDDGSSDLVITRCGDVLSATTKRLQNLIWHQWQDVSTLSLWLSEQRQHEPTAASIAMRFIEGSRHWEGFSGTGSGNGSVLRLLLIPPVCTFDQDADHGLLGEAEFLIS